MNNKSKLNTYCQKSHKPIPCYSSQKKGDDFVSTVTLGETSYHSIQGHSTKKEAENDAAGVAIQAIVQSHSSNKSIEELIEEMPASKHKKKQKQPKPDTQQPEQHGPEFTPISALTQTPMIPANSHRIVQPILIGDHQKHSSADPSVLNRTFPLPGQQPAKIPAQVLSQHHQPTGTAFNPFVSQQSFPQPPPHPLFNGQVPILHPTVATRPHIPVSLHRPMYVQPPPGYAMSSTAAGYTSSAMNTNYGKPLTAIPSPIRASPPGLQAVSSPNNVQPPPPPPQQNITSDNLLENVKVNTTKKDSVDLSKSLEDYCKQRGLPDPIYNVKEIGGKYSAKVKVGDETYCTEQDFFSFVTAKENVTLKALATVGMKALNLGSHNSSTPESSIAPNSLTDTSLDSQVNSSPHSTGPSDVLPVSQDKTTESENTALKPPSFFQQSTEGRTSQIPVPPNAISQNPPTCIPGPDSTVTPAHNIATKGMEGNHKATLNTYCQKNRLEFFYDCTYPEDEVGYIATVSVGGKKFTSTPHGTKRAAEDHAAEQAVQYFGGYREMNRTVHHPVSVSAPVTQHSASSITSFKNLLQEYCQKSKISLPHYETERTESGFKSTVRIHPTSETTMEYTSSAQPVKKAAEQEAAKLACEGLNIV